MLEKVAKHLPGLHPLAWLRDTLRMRARVHHYEFTPAPEGEEIAVVITPWCGSSVPWFSLALGLFLASGGHRVTLVMDDTRFGETSKSWRFQVTCIRWVLGAVGPRARVVGLPAAAPAPSSPEELRDIESLAALNGVWFQRGELNVRDSKVEAMQAQLVAADGRIRSLLADEHFDAVLVPGGVWGSSGLWVRHARERGVRVVSYDSGGYGKLLLAVDGVACQLRDIPRAMNLLQARFAGSDELAYVERHAAHEIDARRKGVDAFASQVQASGNRDPRFDGAVLIALNSSWDSAALGLHRIFATTHEWIVGTVRHLLEHTQAPVIVRQHPVERLEIARSDDDYRSLLAKHFGDHPRLHFVGAADDVNSYELLAQLVGVVVYTSTFGLEATIHGRAVVTESNSYYADRGFVWQARTCGEYETLLSELAAGKLQPTPAMRADATTCYYLTQCCNWVTTPLNVPGFEEWIRQPLEQLGQHESVRRIVRAIAENVPVAYLNHLARLAA